MKPPFEFPCVMVAGSSAHGEAAIRNLRLANWPCERVIDRGFQSTTQLWNMCALQCPTEGVIITSEAARPSRRNLEVICGLFSKGYALVCAASFNLIGFRKEMLRDIGPFDENCGLGEMIVRMWDANLPFANMNRICEVKKNAPTFNQKVWGTPTEQKNTFLKWDLRGTCQRIQDEPKLEYDFGKSSWVPTIYWDFSIFKNGFTFFDAVLPKKSDLSKRECEVFQLRALKKAHREFLVK